MLCRVNLIDLSINLCLLTIIPNKSINAPIIIPCTLSSGNRGVIAEPQSCPACQALGSLQIVHNRCLFADKQLVRLQERPDEVNRAVLIVVMCIFVVERIRTRQLCRNSRSCYSLLLYRQLHLHFYMESCLIRDAFSTVRSTTFMAVDRADH